MQIFLGIILVIILIGIIIYKLDNKFEKREIIILSSIVIIVILVFTMYQKNQENFFPNAFKEKYKQENNIEILKLSSELLNNKVVSSKDHYIYKFTYIIKKNGKEYLCVANNVNINKIQDEYIFDKWTEECKEQ
ncbi:conserved hypothetical protein [Arcobacter nitrofigilis DSM 7299]|uniref:Uncharacterized protein n=1 Tax=Arcobacter nitrofigilis (strain ATCC 33309 / DSM 7299 / CCUG 15893 / LMG 7604 / NCTC 12251 / CI) TaxID=572480 RepID=D5V2Y1_ARCNC|nr:hypothetical protein [Arcobacter nitrofigilis]ADG92563.1 conserved hypothetical protein [Arcobacter nitrofigilis DSM 7299]